MQTITPADLAALGDAATVIDVREPDEFAAARVDGAVNLPLSELEQRVGEIPADRTVYLMCHSGRRSARAAEYLGQQGYDVVNVLGGISEWHASGLPVEIGD